MHTIKWISEGIKEECKKKGTTFYNISVSAKIPKSTIMNIVNMKIKNPGIETMERICVGLDISLLDFINEYYIEEIV